MRENIVKKREKEGKLERKATKKAAETTKNSRGLSNTERKGN